jgi:hypothetical protein
MINDSFNGLAQKGHLKNARVGFKLIPTRDRSSLADTERMGYLGARPFFSFL